MEQLGHILQAYVRDLGIEKPLKRYDAMTIWPEVVGEKIAKVTHPLRFDNGKLFVQVKTPSWRNELVFHKAHILEELNKQIGEPVVDDIVLI